MNTRTLSKLGTQDDGAPIGGFLGWVSDGKLTNLRCELVDELMVQGAMRKGAGGCGAALSWL